MKTARKQRWYRTLYWAGLTFAACVHTNAHAAGLPELITAEVPVIEDAGVVQITTAPTNGGASTFLLSDRVTGEFDHNYFRFDLSVLPVDAIVNDAYVQMNVSRFDNPGTEHTTELGLVEGLWAEGDRIISGSVATAGINESNEPIVSWLGVTKTLDNTGSLQLSASEIVQNWLDGVYENFGLVLRGITPATGTVLADSREGGTAPVLVVTYEIPAREGAISDLGDAPDSTNHHGINNTAYPGNGTLGNFPTVRDPNLGMSTGPYHVNPVLEGYLGDYISHEVEADQDLDADIANNILLNVDTGVLDDVADRDRGDDGWRNRNVDFAHCESELLRVRVSRGELAEVLKTMYLNVWFDSNRDGDWEDQAPCAPGGGGAVMASEWIVQDQVIEIDAIDQGGFLDLEFQSGLVLNRTPRRMGWVRFMLSDTPLVPIGQAPDPVPNGQGPVGGFGYGETEDYIHRPSPVTKSQVVLTHEVFPPNDGSGLTPYYHIYEARLRNFGTETITASMDSDIDPFMYLYWLCHDCGTPESTLQYAFIESSTGGVAPMEGYGASNTSDWWLENPRPDFGDFVEASVGWSGTLEPGAEVILEYKALANYNDLQPWPCAVNQATVQIPSQVIASIDGGETLRADSYAELNCFDGYW